MSPFRFLTVSASSDNVARSGATRQQRGYTLLELVAVVSIVAVLAAVALPGFNPSRAEKLDLAASQVADTIRFARSEAIRTGNPVYVEIDESTDRLLIAEADLSGATVVAGATLRHPIDKKLLDVILSSAGTTSGVEFTNDPFDYPVGGRQASVVFDAQGLPFRKAAGVNQLLTLGEVDLDLGDLDRTVMVAPITGRVTIQ